jgi:hypothetical protein
MSPELNVNFGRPFNDDDPSEWERLPTDHPYPDPRRRSSAACEPCSWRNIWLDDEAVWSRGGAGYLPRARHHANPWYGSHLDYPRRFRAALDHYNAVMHAHVKTRRRASPEG